MTTETLRESLLSFLPADAVSDAPHDLAQTRLSNPLLDPGVDPDLVLRPPDPEALRLLVGAANRLGLNLTVSSSSGPHVRGGAVAGRENLRVDLSRWKGIDWINRRNRVCMIQPGVTYGELLAALEPQGMTVPMPLAPRSGKSVVAAVSDREPSTWPNRQWDLSDPVASTEFVFGSGEVFRTGAAGGPGTLEEQRAAGGAQKSPLGPSQTDFHRVVQGAQGTMGLITWITMRAELKPSIEKPWLLAADRLEKLIPFVYEVQRPWLGEHSFLLDRTALAMLVSGCGRGAFDAIRKSLPPFACLQNIAGFERLPKERVAYQQQDIREIASRHDLALERGLGAVSARGLLDLATRPCGERDWRHALRGHCLSIFFLTTLDRVPAHGAAMSDLARAHGIGEDETGCYVQPVVQNHACHVEFLLPFDPGHPEDLDRLRRFERAAVERLAAERAFFSRPYGSAPEVVFRQNPGNTEVLKKIKAIFDPNQVLNRGKWALQPAGFHGLAP